MGPPRPSQSGLIPYSTDSPQDIHPATSPRLLAVQLHPHTPFTECSTAPSWEPSQASNSINYQQRLYPTVGTVGRSWSEGSNSQAISSRVLLINHQNKPRWPRGSDYLGSTCAFTLSLHSLWSLPISVLQHGGVTFLLMYTVILATLGAPLLLLEMSLGQYSGLAPGRLFRHLCPLLSGLGLAVCLQAAVRAVLDLAVLMWAGQALWLVFSEQNIRDGFFFRDVLDKGEASLAQLGDLDGHLSLVLAIGSVTIFILMGAGTRSVGKVCMIAVPGCFMLLMTLTIRGCLATGGPDGVLILLSPDWNVVTQPTVWLEATGQVILSLQLGLGAVSAYSSYNTYQHNIVRDCAIIVISHLVWVILAILLVFSLLGVAHNTKTINLTTLASDPALTSITGHCVLLAAITLVERSLDTISTGWLWAGLYFILLIIVCITSVFGYLEVISSSLSSQTPTCLPFKPAITFSALAIILLIDLLMATQGGIHVYHLLLTYISNWPTLLFSLLTVLATALCHGTNYLMKDLSNMSKLSLPHWVTSHLSVIYISVLPTFLIATLCWHLFSLSLDHLESPLTIFQFSLSSTPGLPLAWSLSILPAAPLLAGAMLSLIWGTQPLRITNNLWYCFRPTEQWYRNHYCEMAESES